MSEPERPTCGTCPFFDRDVDGSNVSLCKRFPPTIQIGLNEESFPDTGHFPAVDDWLWCGEHPDFPAYLEAAARLSRGSEKCVPYRPPEPTPEEAERVGRAVREWCETHKPVLYLCGVITPPPP